MTARKPATVEVLERGRWVLLGEFSTTRARKMVPLLRREGQIVRSSAEPRPAGRIEWAKSPDDKQVFLGTVDQIDIFILTSQPWASRWALFTRLPGYDGKPVYTDSEAEGQRSADDIIAEFAYRIGASTR